MESKASGFHPTDVEVEELRKQYFGSKFNFVEVGPKKYVMNNTFDTGEIYSMVVRRSDVFLSTFPRSGTTWTQEMVWLLCNDLDYDTAKSLNIWQRFPLIEQEMYYSDTIKYCLKNDPDFGKTHRQLLETMTVSPSVLEKQSSRRFLKTHFPLSLLPPNLLDTAKMVYVARDPRDVAVSYFFHHKFKKLTDYSGDFKSFWQLFINSKLLYTPYFSHVLEAWEHRHHPNLLILFYDDMVKDLPSCVRRVAKFLEVTISEDQVSGLCHHLSFDNFKRNPATNYEWLRDAGLLNDGTEFVRKGKAGGWHAYFDEEMTRQAEQWIRCSLQNTDYPLSA